MGSSKFCKSPPAQDTYVIVTEEVVVDSVTDVGVSVLLDELEVVVEESVMEDDV